MPINTSMQCDFESLSIEPFDRLKLTDADNHCSDINYCRTKMHPRLEIGTECLVSCNPPFCSNKSTNTHISISRYFHCIFSNKQPVSDKIHRQPLLSIFHRVFSAKYKQELKYSLHLTLAAFFLICYRFGAEVHLRAFMIFIREKCGHCTNHS